MVATKQYNAPKKKKKKKEMPRCDHCKGEKFSISGLDILKIL